MMLVRRFDFKLLSRGRKASSEDADGGGPAAEPPEPADEEGTPAEETFLEFGFSDAIGGRKFVVTPIIRGGADDEVSGFQFRHATFESSGTRVEPLEVHHFNGGSPPGGGTESSLALKPEDWVSVVRFFGGKSIVHGCTPPPGSILEVLPPGGGVQQ